jgi:phosphotransferase system IIA component
MDSLLLTAPIGGWAMALSDVPDAAFAGGMIGEGAAIDPLDGTVRAPCVATVSSLA